MKGMTMAIGVTIAIVILITVSLAVIAITGSFDRFKQQQGTLTISRSCLEGGNEIHLIDNHVLKSCNVDVDCFGSVSGYINSNIFDCDGQISITFTNSTKIVVYDNIIKHNLKFLEIEEFVFTDTETGDEITIRGGETFKKEHYCSKFDNSFNCSKGGIIEISNTIDIGCINYLINKCHSDKITIENTS